MTSPEIVERIRELMVLLGEVDYEHRAQPGFLENLEDGEAWCDKMGKLINE